MADKLQMSYSRTNTFLRCRMLYHWIYDEDLTPPTKDIPLMVGDLVHRLLDKYYRGELKIEDLSDLVVFTHKAFPAIEDEVATATAIEAARLFNGYVQEHADDELQVISPEVVITNEYPDFILYTRLDGLFKDPEEDVWRAEHKTTKRLDSFFLRGLRRGLQTGIAHWLLEDTFPKPIKGTMFNLLVKKTIPEFPRTFVTKNSFGIDLAKKIVHGVVRSINHGDYYPSGDCEKYNRTCEYQILCRNDTKANREAFFVSRKEVMEKSKALDL